MPRKYYCITCMAKIYNREDLQFHKDVGHKIILADKRTVEQEQDKIEHLLTNEVKKARAIFKKNPNKYLKPELGKDE